MVQQWALGTKKIATDTYALTDATLLSYMKSSRLPECPGSGTYSPGATVTSPPTCSLAASGHAL